MARVGFISENDGDLMTECNVLDLDLAKYLVGLAL